MVIHTPDVGTLILVMLEHGRQILYRLSARCGICAMRGLSETRVSHRSPPIDSMTPMHNIVVRLEALVSVVSTGVVGWLA
jgi:hypothetical protein